MNSGHRNMGRSDLSHFQAWLMKTSPLCSHVLFSVWAGMEGENPWGNMGILCQKWWSHRTGPLNHCLEESALLGMPTFYGYLSEKILFSFVRLVVLKVRFFNEHHQHHLRSCYKSWIHSRHRNLEGWTQIIGF